MRAGIYLKSTWQSLANATRTLETILPEAVFVCNNKRPPSPGKSNHVFCGVGELRHSELDGVLLAQLDALYDQWPYSQLELGKV